MIEQLRQVCRRLLEDKTVQVVIGYTCAAPDGQVYPAFITRSEDVDKLVFNERCFPNLTTYLTRKEIRDLGKPAIIVKGCDERTLVVLEKEEQIDRKNICVIGVACAGVGEPRLAKCRVCSVHMPRYADEVIGEIADEPVKTDRKYTELDEFLQKTPAERMAFWRDEFERCVKCYACRQVCPLCYCERCIVDKNRPTIIDTSATLKGNFAWHITRAFHLAARCVGCGECVRVCPARIDLHLLNMSLAKAAEEKFGYIAGMDPEAEPVVGAFSQQDKEDFIR